jgi:hypothetical protein
MLLKNLSRRNFRRNIRWVLSIKPVACMREEMQREGEKERRRGDEKVSRYVY